MKKILQVKNIYKSFPGKPKPFKALEDISFDGFEGEVVGILGPNGSGKTTIVKSIASLLDFDSGDINIGGLNLRENRKKILYKMGAVLDGNRNIYWRLTALENIYYFAGLRGLQKSQIQQKIDELLDALMLHEIKDKEVRLLSRGMKQKIAIACSLVHSPSLVLLDEPTLGLDIEISRSMEDWIINFSKKENSCILVTSHDMDFIEKVCDRVIIIKRGKIIFQGPVKEIKEKFFSLKKVQVSLDSKVSPPLLNSLKEICPLDFWEAKDKSLFSLRIGDLNSLSQITNLLKIENINLKNIHTIEDDFEDIFMNIIKT